METTKYYDTWFCAVQGCKASAITAPGMEVVLRVKFTHNHTPNVKFATEPKIKKKPGRQARKKNPSFTDVEKAHLSLNTVDKMIKSNKNINQVLVDSETRLKPQQRCGTESQRFDYRAPSVDAIKKGLSYLGTQMVHKKRMPITSMDSASKHLTNQTQSNFNLINQGPMISKSHRHSEKSTKKTVECDSIAKNILYQPGLQHSHDKLMHTASTVASTPASREQYYPNTQTPAYLKTIVANQKPETLTSSSYQPHRLLETSKPPLIDQLPSYAGEAMYHCDTSITDNDHQSRNPLEMKKKYRQEYQPQMKPCLPIDAPLLTYPQTRTQTSDSTIDSININQQVPSQDAYYLIQQTDATKLTNPSGFFHLPGVYQTYSSTDYMNAPLNLSKSDQPRAELDTRSSTHTGSEYIRTIDSSDSLTAPLQISNIPNVQLRTENVGQMQYNIVNEGLLITPALIDNFGNVPQRGNIDYQSMVSSELPLYTRVENNNLQPVNLRTSSSNTEFKLEVMPSDMSGPAERGNENSTLTQSPRPQYFFYRGYQNQ